MPQAMRASRETWQGMLLNAAQEASARIIPQGPQV